MKNILNQISLVLVSYNSSSKLRKLLKYSKGDKYFNYR